MLGVMLRCPLRFSATLGEEPEVELAAVDYSHVRPTRRGTHNRGRTQGGALRKGEHEVAGVTRTLGHRTWAGRMKSGLRMAQAARTSSYSAEMQRPGRLEFRATSGREPEVELALV